MTPDRYTVTLERINEIVETLRRLEIPADAVHSLSVDHWTSAAVVGVHINGATETTVELVDRIADPLWVARRRRRDHELHPGRILGRDAGVRLLWTIRSLVMTPGMMRDVPNTPGTPRRTIRVPDALWAAAAAKAVERGENLSDVIRRALERYVKRR